MTYKDLNVYKRLYKVAIGLHEFLEKEPERITASEIDQLKRLSRSVLADIAEGFTQKSPKAKRYFNFKAMDSIQALMMDLDFLHDIQRISEDFYRQIHQEYDISARQLFKYNQSILERGAGQEVKAS